MTADDARKLVQHRFDRLIKNIDEKITEAALKGQYSFEYYIYYDNYDKDDYRKYIKDYYESQGFLIQFHSKDEYFNSSNDRFYISWEK